MVLSKFIRYLTYYFRFYRVFSNHFRFLSNSLEFFRIFWYSFYRLPSDSSGFFQILSYLKHVSPLILFSDSHRFPRVLLKVLKFRQIFFEIYSVPCVLFSIILSELYSILLNSLGSFGIFRILSEFVRFWPYFLVYSRILSVLRDCLEIFTNSLVFSQIHSDSFISSRNLPGFSQIVSHYTRFLSDSSVFSPILSHSDRISPIRLEFSPYSFRLFQILPESHLFSRNLSRFSHIPSVYSGFFQIFFFGWILSYSLEFFCTFCLLFRIFQDAEIW